MINMLALLSQQSNFRRSVSDVEINQLSNTKQIFSDCYLVSAVNSLSKTAEGKKILKNNIERLKTADFDGYVIHYQNVNNKHKDVFVSNKEIEELDVMQAKLRHRCLDTPTNDIMKALEISMGKLIKEDPLLKNPFSRLRFGRKRFEFNTPANFLNLFTGQKQIKLNEKTPLLTLNLRKKETMELLKKAEMTQSVGGGTGYHLIAGTSFSFNKYFNSWHCLSIRNVDTKNNIITLYEPRQAQEYRVDIDYFIKNFKFISGYFEKPV